MKYRFIEGRPVPSPELIRALARFRVTHYIPKYINIAQAAQHDKFAERYFVEFIPFLDPNSIVLGRDRSLVERAPEEDWKTMPTGRQNANPAHPKTWEIYFGELDKWLPQFHGGFVSIGMDKTYQNAHGARWNVSPESRALNLSAGPLLAHFLNKIHDKAKQHGKRLFMHDTPFFRNHTLSYPGDPDPSWLKALPLIPRDIVFNVWHWKKDTTLDPLGKTYGHELIHLIADDRDWRKPATEGEHMPWEYPGAFAGINCYMAESSFTPNKLLDAAWVAWNPAAVRPHDPDADAAVARYVPLWNFLADGVPMPRSLLAQPADFTPLDISAAANRSRVDPVPCDGKGWVDMGPNVDLRALPAGRIDMAGVPFQIIDESKNNGASIVMVQNRLYTDKTLPSSVEINAKNVKAASLLFLHCLDHAPGWHYLRHKELAGYYYIVFEDGSCDKIQITYATNISNWDGPTRWPYNPCGHTMSQARLAWSGQTTSGLDAYLYVTEWVNPRPDLKIQKIVLRSTFDPVFMNPMLLAITATHPRLGIAPAKRKLPIAASLLAAPKPVGVPLDLSGGKDESERRYVAPDGTTIEAASINNGLSDAIAYGFAQDWRSYVGMVTVDGHQSARADELIFTFPKPVPLTGALVTSRYREQRKAQNFPPMVYDLFIDVFVNGAWEQKASALATCPEETGPAWMPLTGEPVQKLRLRQKRCQGTPDYAGYSFIQLFRKE
ncbi:MAG TPA: hypothetical protein P5137_12230 [Candidatus Brocadiia bacterium]|nr:hypothetical protein [Candidatus Brocadiia bacterium]